MVQSHAIHPLNWTMIPFVRAIPEHTSPHPFHTCQRAHDFRYINNSYFHLKFRHVGSLRWLSCYPSRASLSLTKYNSSNERRAGLAKLYFQWQEILSFSPPLTCTPDLPQSIFVQRKMTETIWIFFLNTSSNSVLNTSIELVLRWDVSILAMRPKWQVQSTNPCIPALHEPRSGDNVSIRLFDPSY